MKRMSVTIALSFLSGLLLISLPLAAGQAQSGKTQMQPALTGEQTQQWNQTQERVQAREQMHLQQQETRQLNREQTREMQRLLTQKGYRPGNIDGIIGLQTRAAIRQFQESAELTVTGMPNQETLRSLATTPRQQEFFGIAPEYGEMEE